MQAMNYQAMGVNYPKKKERKKKRNMDPVPVAPGSLFQFRVIFLKCRREERRSSLEGVRAG